MKDEGEEISLRTPKVADRRHIVTGESGEGGTVLRVRTHWQFADNTEEVLEPCGPCTSSIASPGTC